MWYVRFGGEEFGPFGKSELDEFIGQLGTTASVEVRKADERDWSAIESNRPGAELADVETQDDDKTLMSSDMSPELLAEFRALLDEDSEPLLTEGAIPRFPPPNTRVDDVPDGVIGRGTDESGAADVSLDELLTQSGDSSPAIPAFTPSSHLEQAPKPGMLLPSPAQSGVPSIPNRQTTTVSQTPDMKPPSASGAKRSPRTTSTPPALPSKPTTKSKATVPPQPPKNRPAQPKPGSSVGMSTKSSSTLLPSRPPKQVEAKVTQASASEPVGYERAKPQVKTKPKAVPFQVKRSKKARTVTIAIIVTTVIGGLGAFGIWTKKQESKASQITSASTAVNRAAKATSEPSPKTPAVQKKVTEPGGMMVVEPTKAKPAKTTTQVGAAVIASDDTARAGSAKAEADEAKTMVDPKVKPLEKSSGKPVVTKKAISQPSKKKAKKAPVKKTLSRKWVRKKSKPVLARLNRAAIETVMKRQRSQLKNCKGPKGIKVTVSLEILSSGIVRKSQVFDRRLNDTTKKCISTTLRRAVFPRTKTPVAQIRVPVNL